MRVGTGFDVHRFGPGNKVVLGGVEIAHDQGIVAHSDGDVLLHALADALLGAVGLGDIGRHFPDTAIEFENIDSRILLRDVVKKLHGKGWLVVNIDATVIAERPRVSPHIDAMVTHIAKDLQIEKEAVNIKSTTTEKLGFTGRKEGIAAQVVVLVEFSGTI